MIVYNKNSHDRYGTVTEEWSDGFCCLSIETVGKYRSISVKPVEETLLFPVVIVGKKHVSMNFQYMMVLNKAESDQLYKNINRIWEFLDTPEIKDVLKARR